MDAYGRALCGDESLYVEKLMRKHISITGAMVVAGWMTMAGVERRTDAGARA